MVNAPLQWAIYKLACLYALSLVRLEVPKILEPIQLALSPGGPEAVIHILQAAIDLHPDWVVISTDISNAFSVPIFLPLYFMSRSFPVYGGLLIGHMVLPPPYFLWIMVLLLLNYFLPKALNSSLCSFYERSLC